MEIETKKIEGYLALFNEIEKRTGDDAVALAILEQIGKDTRMAALQARERANGSEGADVPATSKQLAFLARLGVPVEPGLTKQGASALIDEALNGAQ